MIIITGHSKIRLTGFLFSFFFMVSTLSAQQGGEENPGLLILSPRAVVSLITILPGKAVYSAFGHTAYRILDPQLGIDWMFNYGQSLNPFDLTFVPKFVYGKMDFILGVGRTQSALNFYSNYENRTVYEQVLNLDLKQKQKLFAFLQINARRENREYRYDFFFDNCVTRPRDVLDLVLGKKLHYHFKEPVKGSFRRQLDPYLIHRSWLKLGMYMMLGPLADRIPSHRELFFLPLEWMKALNNATVTSSSGNLPLVTAEKTLYMQKPEPHSGFNISPPLVFWLLFLGTALLTFFNFRHKGSALFYDIVLAFISGLIGWLFLFMWFVSEHEVTNYNLNLLWAWPTHLVAAVLLVFKVRKKWLGFYFLAAALVAFLMICFWLLLPQQFPAAFFPLVLMFILRYGYRGYVILAGQDTKEGTG